MANTPNTAATQKKRRTVDGRFNCLVKCYLLFLIHLYSFRMVSFLNARLSFVIDNETDKIHPWPVFQLSFELSVLFGGFLDFRGTG